MTRHECEPKLDELRKIRKAMYEEPSTEDNVKKLRAIEAQIARLSAPIARLSAKNEAELVDG